MLFTKPKKAIGIDIGTHSVKAIQMSRSGGRLCVDEANLALVDREQVNADPVLAHADALREAVRSMQVGSSLLVGAMSGQTAVIRYPRLTDVAREDIGAAIEREAGQNIPYDLSEVFLDWTLLDETEEGGQRQLKMLLVAARHEVIDSRVQIFETAELQCGMLGVDSLALADAAEACDVFRSGETVALVNVGLTSASIHFVRDGISSFIRDVNWGARELIQAIAKERRCDYDEAERLLQTSADEMPPETAQQEVAAPQAAEEEDPLGGGGSLLDPLGDELGGLDEPLGDEAASGGAAMGADRPIREVLGDALGRMVSEIRRSFDFYEHQLYERPVDRLVLSGGVARLPIVGETLVEEIGVETVEVADPTAGPLFLGDDVATGAILDHPAQFMVAIGLAARGMADL